MKKYLLLIIVLLLFVLPLVQAQSLVAHWKFDEGSGLTAFDETENSNDGSLQNGVGWTMDSVSGFALNFDGFSGKVAIGTPPSILFTEEVTLEAYVKRNSTTDGTILAKNGPYYLSIENNVVKGGVYANDGNCPTSCTTPGANTWTYATGTTILQEDVWYKLKMDYDGSNINVYVHDIVEGTVPKIGEMPSVSQSLYLGWGDPGLNNYFNGTLDEVKVYNDTFVSQPIETICDEGIDNDNDGFIDCDDSDCSSTFPACMGPVEICDNDIDDDTDGYTDCEDFQDCTGFCFDAVQQDVDALEAEDVSINKEIVNIWRAIQNIWDCLLLGNCPA